MEDEGGREMRGIPVIQILDGPFGDVAGGWTVKGYQRMLSELATSSGPSYCEGNMPSWFPGQEIPGGGEEYGQGDAE